MVGRSIVGKIAAAAVIATILVTIFIAYGAYRSTKPVTPSTQKPHLDYIVVTPKYYPNEIGGNTQGLEGNPPQHVSITSSMELDFCQTINSPTFVSVPGIDDTNPIILTRNGDEIAIPLSLPYCPNIFPNPSGHTT